MKSRCHKRKKQRISMRSVGKVMRKKGMKTMFGKRYPNCVKKKVVSLYLTGEMK